MTESEEASNTQGKKELFLQALETTRGMIAPAADRAAISRSIVYAWMKSDKKFQKSVKAIQKTILQLMEERLVILGYEGNLKAVIYYLERNHPKYKKKATASRADIYHHVDGKDDDKEQPPSLEEQLWALARRDKEAHDAEELRKQNEPPQPQPGDPDHKWPWEK